MARPNKRRKVDHVSSDEEEDDMRFALFDDSIEEESTESQNTQLLSPDDRNGIDHDSFRDSADGSIDGPGSGSGNTAERNVQDQPYVVRRVSEKPSRLPTSNVGAKHRGSLRKNRFQTQIDSLLESLRPRQGKKESAAQEALLKISHTIERVPARQGSVREAELELLTSNKIAIPFPSPRPPEDAKYKLQYATPENFRNNSKVGRSTMYRLNGIFQADLHVQMPSSMFQEKDYLNYRYFHKRAYYLACVTAGLKERHDAEYEFRFDHLDDNQLKPTLVVSPRISQNDPAITSQKWRIRIVPCVSETALASEKLLLNRNCVRDNSAANVHGTDSTPRQAPTPFYNSSIRSDMTPIVYDCLLERLFDRHAALRDACLLGDAWLRQRGYSSSIHQGGFGKFEFEALMALLLKVGDGTQRFQGEIYSSYQLLKLALQLIASKDFSKEPFSDFPSDRIFKATNGVPVAWDSTRSHNILYKMTPWSYKFLRQEAKTTLATLGSEHFDGFEAVFTTRTDSPLLQFDYVLELNASLLPRDSTGCVHSPLQDLQRTYDVLHRGLGDRVSALMILPQWSESWPLGYSGSSPDAARTLWVGSIVVPETAQRTVDHGPSAENKSEAASFRKFWGEKAELRRFKDGSILESLVWDGKTRDQSVFEQIVRFVLQRHLGNEAEQTLKVVGNGFTALLPQTSTPAAFESLMEAYKQLEVDIRSLDALPLSIRQIMPNDPKLRYTSVVLPSNLRQRSPASITIQFEGSARWPDDLIAIQRTKIAFLLKIGELLEASVDSVTARVGLENEGLTSLNQAFLDIFYESGPSFRLRIHHEREQALLERELKEKLLDQREKEVAAIGLALYKRDYVKGPAFTQAVARLCSRYPALSGAIRLTKEWFAAHLLSHHIPEEVIEMLVARTFILPWPWQIPSSVQTGFLRTLLWLSRWDWHNEPLIVDLSGSGDLKPPNVQALRLQFEAWRKLDPALNRVVLFCGSNIDQDGTAWTDGRTPKVVAARMTALAQAACAEVETKRLELDSTSLFSSPLSDFDFIVYLIGEATRPSIRSKNNQVNGARFKNLEPNEESSDSNFSYDAAQEFLRELSNLYGSVVLFFSGGSGRHIIAGLWNPQTVSRSWKMNLAYSTAPSLQSDRDDVQAAVNKEAILAEIVRVGGDIVRTVETNR